MTAKKRAKQLVGKAPRVDRYVGSTCNAAGCTRPCRALSRYCSRHAQQFFRTRNPLGRMPRKSELNPWRARVVHALDVYGLRDHEAIQATERALERMIANPGGIAEEYARHWRRMYQYGVTGRDMLINILTVFGWRYVGLPNIVGDDALFFCVLGSRFLRTAPLGWKFHSDGRKKEQVRLPGLECEVVGRALSEKLYAVPLQFWQAEEREHNRRAYEALAIQDALKDNPL